MCLWNQKNEKEATETYDKSIDVCVRFLFIIKLKLLKQNKNLGRTKDIIEEEENMNRAPTRVEKQIRNKKRRKMIIDDKRNWFKYHETSIKRYTGYFE